MIRNVVIHLANEQPLLADLPVAPAASDISLICTNLRTLNGKRPVFADDAASLFVFPYAHIRFVEVAPAALAAAQEASGVADGEPGAATGADGHAAAAIVAAAAQAAGAAQAGGASAPAGRGSAGPGTADARSASGPTDGAEESPGGADTDQVEDDLETELEIDEDFLRRVREI